MCYCTAVNSVLYLSRDVEKNERQWLSQSSSIGKVSKIGLTVMDHRCIRKKFDHNRLLRSVIVSGGVRCD